MNNKSAKQIVLNYMGKVDYDLFSLDGLSKVWEKMDINNSEYNGIIIYSCIVDGDHDFNISSNLDVKMDPCGFNIDAIEFDDGGFETLFEAALIATAKVIKYEKVR